MACVILFVCFIGSVGLEVGDSTASSPMIIHRSLPEEVSVQAFKKVLEGPSQKEREEEEAKKKKFQVWLFFPVCQSLIYLRNPKRFFKIGLKSQNYILQYS